MHIFIFLFKEEANPMYSSHLRLIGYYRNTILVSVRVFSASFSSRNWHAVTSNNGVNIMQCKL